MTPDSGAGTPDLGLLRLERLSRSFGAVRAVQDVTLAFPAGQLAAIIGPNGAGKTTLYNLISGRLRPDEGRVVFRGQDIAGLPPHAVARRGLARSFQITNIFMGLSVFENVRAAVIAHRGAHFRWFRPVWREAELNDEAMRILELVGIAGAASRPCKALSHGDRRVVELAIVLALEPELVLLDEPTAGMNPVETQRIVELIRRLRRETGKTFLLTEHDMAIVFAIAERIIVMHQGRVLADGLPDEIRGDAEVKRAYLGGVVV